MDKQFEYRGYWWRPSDPDRQVAGILSYIPNEKIELELIGDFHDDFSNTDGTVMNRIKVVMCASNDNSEAVIHGRIYDSNNHAKDVTLFLCFQSKWNSNLSCGFSIVKYKPRHVLIGRHLSDFHECTFNRLRVYTPIMNNWLFPGAIHYSIHLDKEDKSKTAKMSWEFEPANNTTPKYEVPIDSGFQLSFYGTSSINTEENALRVNLNQATAFELAKMLGKTTLSELSYKMDLFLHFLNLASLAPTPIEELVVFDDDYGEIYDDKFHVKPISWYLISDQKLEKKNHRNINYLFTFKQVSNISQNLIQKWYNDSEIIAPIRNHLVNSISRKSSFDSGDFLIVVQALEGYHRRFVNGKKQSLKKRLQNMVDDFKFIDRIKLTNDELEAIVQSRDYYSHFFKREEKPLLLDGKELFLKYVHLRVLLICCILRLIGFQDDSIKELIKNCHNHILSTEYY